MSKFFKSGICLAVAGLAATAQAETLLDIYQLAQTNDPQYRADYAALQSDLQADNIGRSALLPTVSVGIQSSWSGNLGPSGVDGVESANGVDNDYSASISQSLFDMGDWYSYRSGNLAVDRALVQWEQTEQDLILRSVSAYLDVLRSIDNLETVRAEKTAIESQLEQAQQRFEVGLVPITDVLEAQASYDDIISQELDAEGNLAIAFENLTVLTGQSHLNIAPLMDNFPVEAPQPQAADDWYAIAAENSQVLELSQYSVESAEISKRSALTPYYPTLSARATYSGSLDGVNNAGVLAGNYDEGGAISLTLDVPLVTFTGGSTWARRVQAHHNLIEAEERLLSAERSLEQSVRASHLRLMTSISQVRARLQSIRSSESALEATRAGYEVGTRNLVDVLLAERNVYRARRSYLNTRYDYIETLLNLKATAGVLQPSDLEGINRWLDAQNELSRTQYLP